MKVKAAVFTRPDEPLAIEVLDLEEPKEREVLVRVAACGVCHSDLHFIEGLVPAPSPSVLGHEAAGVVEAVGAAVSSVKPGDHVVLSFIPSCGRCPYCWAGRPNLCIVGNRATSRGTMLDGTTRFSRLGEPVYQLASVGGFATHTVVPETACVRVREDMPLDRAALLGCSVMTGVGAVVNTARVAPGSYVAVIGCGGVGLNVVQGAALAGATCIIAVDVLPLKLELARRFGATHTIDASREDPVSAATKISPGGVDYAFEVVGRPQSIRQAFDMTRRGGLTVVVGVSPYGAEVQLPAAAFLGEKTITGSAYGGARMGVDVPRLVDLYLAGRLKLDELISRVYSLGEIDDAFVALRNGEVARSVVLPERG